ncbi:MAG: hypothetical protein IJU66_06610 [Oscillospiraceae bacterium]|nr:hypothetical protein [Oscillospiraceae bacterium]
MSLESYKITDSGVRTNGVASAPDRLTGTAQENKSLFDRLIGGYVKNLINGLIDRLELHFNDAAYDAGTHVLTLTRENESTKTVTITPSEIALLHDARTGKNYRVTMENGQLVLEEV